jgi:hypothetical protein
MHTGDTGDSFLARQIRDMDEGVVKGRKDMSDSKDERSCVVQSQSSVK